MRESFDIPTPDQNPSPDPSLARRASEGGLRTPSLARRANEGPVDGFFRPAALATIIAIFCCSTVSAASYGDVDVAIETEPSAKATHGYAEMWVRVTNRSKQEAREVRLTLPQHSYSP